MSERRRQILGLLVEVEVFVVGFAALAAGEGARESGRSWMLTFLRIVAVVAAHW
jgi:hypothetical protein